MNENIQKLEQIIQNADKVLIGIGEEFSCEKISLTNSDLYKCYQSKLQSEKDLHSSEWMLEFIKNYHIRYEMNTEQLDIAKSYQKVLDLVRSKDYYVNSMNSDSLLEKVGFIKERIVYPCGNKSKLQCIDNCSNEVWDGLDIEEEIVKQIFDGQIKPNDIQKPVCPKCGKLVQHNLLSNPKYSEEGYLSDWKRYLDWTASTLNKKLCVVELGVGFQYPTVIRWPFEKIAFINHKANFVRINEKFEQVSEELADKSWAVKENSIQFLLND
jgi:NAD-dependent SIR2 family protein deacetylase